GKLARQHGDQDRVGSRNALQMMCDKRVHRSRGLPEAATLYTARAWPAARASIRPVRRYSYDMHAGALLAFMRFESPGYLALLAAIPLLAALSFRSLAGL